MWLELIFFCDLRFSKEWTLTVNQCLNPPPFYLLLGAVLGLPRWLSCKESLPMQEPQETWVWSLDQEDHLEKEMATHSSILGQNNSMDRGEWRATVHGVTKSQTQLSAYAHRAVQFWDSHCTRVLGRGSCSGLYQPVLESLVIVLSSSSPWSSIRQSWELRAISLPFLVTGVFILLLLPPCETVRQSGISA